MGFSAEGEVIIPMEEFREFACKYVPGSWEPSFGVPRITKDGFGMIISFAIGTESHPADWVKKPKCAIEWETHRKQNKGE
jgi:hypothetical protein